MFYGKHKMLHFATLSTASYCQIGHRKGLATGVLRSCGGAGSGSSNCWSLQKLFPVVLCLFFFRWRIYVATSSFLLAFSLARLLQVIWCNSSSGPIEDSHLRKQRFQYERAFQHWSNVTSESVRAEHLPCWPIAMRFASALHIRCEPLSSSQSNRSQQRGVKESSVVPWQPGMFI